MILTVSYSGYLKTSDLGWDGKQNNLIAKKKKKKEGSGSKPNSN